MKLRNLIFSIIGICASTMLFAQSGFNSGAYFANPTSFNNVPMCTQFIGGLCVYTPTLLFDEGVSGGLQYNGDIISGGSGGSVVKVIYLGNGSGLGNSQHLSPITPLTQLTLGSIYEWKASAANTSSTPNILLPGIGATTIRKCGTGIGLTSSDINSNIAAQAMFDGTYLQLMNPQVIPCSSASAINNGNIGFATLSSQLTCAANGTAANPSLVACTAGPVGSFSCDPAASTGTCVVSSTAITANSQILLTPTASKGTLLSVTCNTAPTLPPSVLITAQATGTFTVKMPTYTTNPVCYDYLVIN
jgi:hypothetical protein